MKRGSPIRSTLLILLICPLLTLTLLFREGYGAGTIKACGHHDYAPWNWLSNNEITGACAEITRELFKRVGVETDLTYTGDWKRCQALIAEGLIDVNICSFINEDRKTYSTFINTPMGFNENAVFVHRSKQFEFRNWNQLIGKKTAMVLGVSIGQEFDDFLEKMTRVDRVATFFQSFHMLARNRIDFIPVGRYSGLAMRGAFGLENKIVDLPVPLLSGKLYISMSKKSKYLHLLPEIEKFMQEETYLEWVEELLQKYTAIYAAEYKKQHPDDIFKTE